MNLFSFLKFKKMKRIFFFQKTFSLKMAKICDKLKNYYSHPWIEALCIKKKKNKTYVCVLFYFIFSQIWLLKIQKDQKKCTSLYIFGSLLGPCMGIWSPKFFLFFYFLEFLQLFQQIIENSHSQKEEGWIEGLASI